MGDEVCRLEVRETGLFIAQRQKKMQISPPFLQFPFAEIGPEAPSQRR
jgi:hypothetical protein